MKDSTHTPTNLPKLDLVAAVYGTELIIDKPIHEVWRHLSNYNDWNPEHIGAKVERVAGRKNAEGEVILEQKRSGDGYAPPWFIETLNLIQNERIVWAMYGADTGLAGGIGFVEFTLRAVGGKTLFVSRGYAAYPSTVVGTTDKVALQRSWNERTERSVAELKAYIERN